MKNILSYVPGSRFKGAEIQEWINYHSNNTSSHFKNASWLKSHFHIINDGVYSIKMKVVHEGDRIKKPFLHRVT